MDAAAVVRGVVRYRTAVHGKQAGGRCQRNGAAVGSRAVCDLPAVHCERSVCADDDRAADAVSDVTAGDHSVCACTVLDGQISVLDLKNTDGRSVGIQGMAVQVDGQLFAVPDRQSDVVLFRGIILRQRDHRQIRGVVDLILKQSPVANVFPFLPFCVECQVSRAALCDLCDNVIFEEFVVIPAKEVVALPCRVCKRDRLAHNRIGSGIAAAVLAVVQFISDFVHHRRKRCGQGHSLRRHGKTIISVFGRLDFDAVHKDAGNFVPRISFDVHSDDFALVGAGRIVCADRTVCAGLATDRVHRDLLKFRGDQERVRNIIYILDVRHYEPVFAIFRCNFNRHKGY